MVRSRSGSFSRPCATRARRSAGTLPPGPTAAKLALYDPALALLVGRRLRAAARAGAPFDVVLATDGELAPDRFALSELSRYQTVALPGCWWLTEHQVSTLISYLDDGGCVVGTDEPALNLDAGLRERLLRHPRYRRAAVDGPSTLQPLGPQVVASAELAVHLQRGESDVVACHLINYGYDEHAEAVTPLTQVQLDVRLPDVTVGADVEVRRPDAAPIRVPVRRQGEYWRCTLPEIGIYAIVVFATGSATG